jgi:nucleoside-diphosphate-sugar epimerase
MKALVTGVAGFIGSHLAEALIDTGADVVGIDSFLDYYPREMKERNLEVVRKTNRFRLIESPLNELDLRPLVSATEVVFHLAAQAGVRASWGREFSIYTENNVLATQRLLEASVGQSLNAFVYASSSSVYGDGVKLPMCEEVPLHPVSPYGVSKLAAEMLCHLYFVNHGVPSVSLRYFTVYGPRQRPDMAFHRLFKSVILDEEVPLYGDGKQTRDFTFVGDAVQATIVAAKSGRAGCVYNIGGGSRVSLLEVIAEIETITGSKLRLRRESSQKGDMRDTYADTGRAREDLEYRPSVDLKRGLEAEWNWLRALL